MLSTNQWTFRRNATDIPPLTTKMLYALQNVKIITEYLDVQTSDKSPESLAFLGNLTIIEGRQLRYVVFFRQAEISINFTSNSQ